MESVRNARTEWPDKAEFELLSIAMPKLFWYAIINYMEESLTQDCWSVSDGPRTLGADNRYGVKGNTDIYYAYEEMNICCSVNWPEDWD